ncbi:shikimate dehydrogenase [Thiogranum longum]
MNAAAPRCEGTDRYAVMGNPIAHSKSPQIHRLFAEQTDQPISYEAILVAIDGFARAVSEFVKTGGKGLNITVPFKQEAWRLAGELSDRARRAGAVNTISIDDRGQLYGDNTDGVGLLRDLTVNLGIEVKDKRILMLGAGGAARGVLAPLLEQHPAQLVIGNRTAERAERLAAAFADLGSPIGCGFDALAGSFFDIVINATSAGLQGQVPDLPKGIIGPESCCYDMMYGKEPTAFVTYAQRAGVQQAFDGLGMLVEQAAESFRIWRGILPETTPVIETLRRQ